MIRLMYFVLAFFSFAVNAATFFVTDDGNEPDRNVGDGTCASNFNRCTLRSAVQEANYVGGHSTIYLSSIREFHVGTYSDPFDDVAVDGDLDILSNITIIGNGPELTKLDGFAGEDRIFEVHPGARLTLIGMSVTGGASFQSVNGDFGIALEANPRLNFPGAGGGIFNRGELYLENVRVYDNCVLGLGAGIAAGLNSYTEINNSVIENNKTCRSAGVAGGGIGAVNARGIVIKNSVIQGNNHWLNREWNRIDLPASSLLGGGIFFLSDGELTIENTLIQDHWTMDGAGIYFGLGKLRIKNSTIQDNFARRSGGGIYFLRDQVGDSRFIDNNAPHLVNVSVVNNGAGGFDLDDETFVGDLEIYNYGPLTNGVFGGAGVFVNAESATMLNTMRVVNSIFSNNRLMLSSSDLTNFVLESCQFTAHGSLRSLGGNVNDDGSCGMTAPTDQIADPQLQPIAFNQGFNDTIAISSTSPAVDAGERSFCPETDQRGYVRGGETCDSGAFEESGLEPKPVVYPQIHAVQPGGLAAGTLSMTYTGSGVVTFQVMTQPSKGSLVFNRDTEGVESEDDYIYLASANGSGTDRFTYIACVEAFSLCSEPAEVSFVLSNGLATGAAHVTVIADGGVTVDDVHVIHQADLSATVNDVDYDFPLGVIFFTASDVPENYWVRSLSKEALRVTLQFPRETVFPLGAEMRKMDIYGNWRTIPWEISERDKRVTVTIVDNDIFDNNSTPGIINDPIAIGVPKGRGLEFEDLQRASTEDPTIVALRQHGSVPGGVGMLWGTLMLAGLMLLARRKKT